MNRRRKSRSPIRRRKSRRRSSSRLKRRYTLRSKSRPRSIKRSKSRPRRKIKRSRTPPRRRPNYTPLSSVSTSVSTTTIIASCKEEVSRTKKMLNRFSLVFSKTKITEETECPICLDKITEIDCYNVKCCKLQLHRSCLKNLLEHQNNDKCPQCRQKMLDPSNVDKFSSLTG